MRFIIDLTLLSISLWWTFAVFPSSIYKHCIRHYGHSTDQSSYNRWIARGTGTHSEFFPPRDQNLCLVILLCECNKFKFSPGGISHFVDPSMEKYLKDHILIAVISIEFETYINISFNFHERIGRFFVLSSSFYRRKVQCKNDSFKFFLHRKKIIWLNVLTDSW